MERFKIAGNLSIKLPSDWSEVPYGKGVIIIEDRPNEIETMALLSGVEIGKIRDSTNFETIYYLMSAYDFLNKLPDLSRPRMPLSVVLNGSRIVFPNVLYGDKFDLGEISVGQVKDMQMIIENMVTAYIGETLEGQEPRGLTELETIKICPYLVAIYLQKIIDRQYDYKKAMKLVSVISDQLSFYEVTNIGYFFLQRLTELRTGSKINYQKPRSIKRKLMRGWWTLTERMALIRR